MRQVKPRVKQAFYVRILISNEHNKIHKLLKVNKCYCLRFMFKSMLCTSLSSPPQGLAVYWILINKYYNHPSKLINNLVRSIKDTFIPLVGNSPNTTNQKLLIYKQNQHYTTEGGQANQSYGETNSGPGG